MRQIAGGLQCNIFRLAYQSFLISHAVHTLLAMRRGGGDFIRIILGGRDNASRSRDDTHRKILRKL